MGIQNRALATLVFITAMLCTYPARSAQDEAPYPGANTSRLRMTPDSGFYVTSLIDLVKSADIIIEGRYGDFIRNFPLYGYDEDGSDKPPKPGSPGIPMSEYEILPSRVLKGEGLVSGPLVLRITESPGRSTSPVIRAQRSGSHLFFLALNPDHRTAGLHGGMFDMKETDEAYTFIKAGDIATALDSDDKELFLKRLGAILASETGIEQ